jgi:hypothetical protein
MHALLVMRADALDGCTEDSPEVVKLTAEVDVVEAYEAVRWPHGKFQAAAVEHGPRHHPNSSLGLRSRRHEGSPFARIGFAADSEGLLERATVNRRVRPSLWA